MGVLIVAVRVMKRVSLHTVLLSLYCYRYFPGDFENEIRRNVSIDPDFTELVLLRFFRVSQFNDRLKTRLNGRLNGKLRIG